jgi:tetratricopeptide (TPR) repeat protein
LLVLIVLVLGGCASKRLAKKALKFEQAGMYEQAAELFYQSVKAKPKNVDAAVGLNRTGQRVLDDKFLQVHKSYFNGNDKETVYSFLEADEYHKKINAVGVRLNVSESSKGYFEEAKPRYLQSLYEEGRILLDEEKFKESEAKFAEIKRIDPGYKGVDEHMKVSRCEPIYREGLEFMASGFNRKAYFNFNNIIVNYGSYKDSKELRDEAQTKATITISMGEIANRSRFKDANLMVESKINTALNDLKNPFIKIVDTKNTEQLVNQQVRGASVGADIRVGKILAAKAILSGAVIRFEPTEGKPETVERRGYIREVITTKDKETGEEKKETRYHKVVYSETTRKNTVSLSFQYQLTSTETGVVMVSDAININENDEVRFATYKGDKNSLVPGHWDHRDKESPKDRIDDTPAAVQSLQNLLNARQNPKSTVALQNEAIDEVAKRVASKINQYNPEN